MPQENFKETWTVTDPPAGLDRPSWERTGPTVTREVEGVGYQPAIGGYGRVQHAGGQSGQPFYGTLRVQGHLDTLKARNEARRANREPLPVFIAPQWMVEESELRQEIQMKELEMELASLETATVEAPAPAASHVRPLSPDSSFGVLVALLVVALMGVGIGSLRRRSTEAAAAGRQ
jgi:hypothetical protein